MDIISILRDHGVNIGTVKKNGGGGLGNSYVVAHSLPTTELSQKTWNVPEGAYDSETDTILLYHNTGILDKESWTLSGSAATGYQVNIPDNPETAIEDNNVIIVVLRNAPTVPNGVDISGTRLTNGSVGLAKLGQDVKDAIAAGGGGDTLVRFIPAAPPSARPSTYEFGINWFETSTTESYVQEWMASVGLPFDALKMPIAFVETVVLLEAGNDVPQVVQTLKIYLGALKAYVFTRRGARFSWHAWTRVGVDIVNDLTTGGADKAASADTVKNLNENQEQHNGKIATGTTLGHVKGSDTLTIDPDGTAHAKQVEILNNTTDGGATKAASAETVKKLQNEVDNALKINAYNAVSTSTSLGETTARRSFGNFLFTNTTTSEYVAFDFNTKAIFGLLKLKIASTYSNGNGSGGAEINLHIGFIDGVIHRDEMDIISMPKGFADMFYINPLSVYNGKLSLAIYKRQRNSPIAVDMEFITPSGNSWSVLNDVTIRKVTQDNVINVTSQQSIFTHVGNSKEGLAVAITGKGKPTSKDDTFATMIANINGIVLGSRKWSGTLTSTDGTSAFSSYKLDRTEYLPTVTLNLPFNPSIVTTMLYTSTPMWFLTRADRSGSPFSQFSSNSAEVVRLNGTYSNTGNIYHVIYPVTQSGSNFIVTIPVGLVNSVFNVVAYE